MATAPWYSIAQDEETGMSEADDLYSEGEAFYKAGKYAAAAECFSQLLRVVPDAGKTRGRAAYSLALAQIKLDQVNEARRSLALALEADPELQRAREWLTKLDAQHPVLPSPTTPGGMVGVARRIRQGQEPDPIFGQQRNPFISFRLETSGIEGMPASPTIELRGQRIEGSVEDGDLVEIPGPWRPGERPPYVINLTTGETVRAVRSGVRIMQWVVLGGFLLGFGIFAIWVWSHMLG